MGVEEGVRSERGRVESERGVEGWLFLLVSHLGCWVDFMIGMYLNTVEKVNCIE